MILKEILIREEWDGSKYKGHIEFEANEGSMTVKLDDGLSKKVMALVAEELVAHSKNVAESMTAQVFTQPAIENKVEVS